MIILCITSIIAHLPLNPILHGVIPVEKGGVYDYINISTDNGTITLSDVTNLGIVYGDNEKIFYEQVHKLTPGTRLVSTDSNIVVYNISKPVLRGETYDVRTDDGRYMISTRTHHAPVLIHENNGNYPEFYHSISRIFRR